MPKRSTKSSNQPNAHTASFDDHKRDIAARNGKAHDAARKLRDAEREKAAARKRRRDMDV